MRQGLSTSLRSFRSFRSFRSLGLSLGLTAGLLSVGSVGCSSSAQKPDLTVTSLHSGQRYSQQFKEGYVRRDNSGDTDIVLATAADHPGRLPGVLKQVMHIRVLWHPDRETAWEGAADTNASIRWYVFTERNGQPEMIEYAGTGLVAVKSDGDETAVTVRKASLRPTFSHGALTDPIGSSQFEGTIVTRSDRPRVEQLLSEVRTTLAATSSPAEPVQAVQAAQTAEAVEAKTTEARVPVLP